MSSAWLLLAALALDLCLGEPRRAHPLVAFGRLAERLQQRFNPGGAGWRSHGVSAWALAVLPLTLASAGLVQLPVIGVWLEIFLLYLAIGQRSLLEHAQAVASALRLGDLTAARAAVARMVSRDTASLDEQGVARAACESVLENGNDALFATLFWFCLLGAPGAVLYRLANTLDAMWGYRTAELERFGWAAARIDDLLNYLPARLVALSYALLGTTWRALRCWQLQAGEHDSPNAGPVMAAGAGALNLALGGPARYHGAWQMRPLLGEGQAPRARDIERCNNLVVATCLFWLLLIVLGFAYV